MKELQGERIVPTRSCIRIYELRAGQEGWPGAVHAHAFFQLWYIRSGSCVHEIGGEVCKLSPGEILIVPPYVVHMVTADSGGCSIYACDISEEMLSEDPVLTQNQACGQAGCLLDVIMQIRGRYTLTDVVRPRVERILERMLDIGLKQDTCYELELKGYFLRLLAFVIRSMQAEQLPESETDAYTGNIDDAWAYTAAHIGERILLKDIAACAKMSVSSFNHYFRKHTGKTYVEYTNMLRLDLAKKLLTETSLSVAAIGLQVGFRNAAYFNRTFKRQEGCTPGEYRSRCIDE